MRMADRWSMMRLQGSARSSGTSSHVAGLVKANRKLPQFIRLFALRVLKESTHGGKLEAYDPNLLFDVPYSVFMKFADVYIDDLSVADDFIDWFSTHIEDPSYLQDLECREHRINRLSALPYWAFWGVISQSALVEQLILGRSPLRTRSWVCLSLLHDEALEILLGHAVKYPRRRNWLLDDFSSLAQVFYDLPDLLAGLDNHEQMKIITNCAGAWQWLKNGARSRDLKRIRTYAVPSIQPLMTHRPQLAPTTPMTPIPIFPTISNRPRARLPLTASHREPSVSSLVRISPRSNHPSPIPNDRRRSRSRHSKSIHPASTSTKEHRERTKRGPRLPRLQETITMITAHNMESENMTDGLQEGRIWLDRPQDETAPDAQKPQSDACDEHELPLCPFPSCRGRGIQDSSGGVMTEIWYLDTCFTDTGLGVLPTSKNRTQPILSTALVI